MTTSSRSKGTQLSTQDRRRGPEVQATRPRGPEHRPGSLRACGANHPAPGALPRPRMPVRRLETGSRPFSATGVAKATLDHTLVRKALIVKGNTNWALSAGTTPEDSEWIVLDKDNSANLGKVTEPPPPARKQR